MTGHDAAIAETAGLTSEKPELSAEELDKLSRRLVYAIEKDATIRITYFHPDLLKQGGSYCHTEGKIKKIDEIEGLIILSDKHSIPLDGVMNIESNLFNDIEL